MYHKKLFFQRITVHQRRGIYYGRDFWLIQSLSSVRKTSDYVSASVKPRLSNWINVSSERSSYNTSK